MIPALDDRGLLPAGIHDARSWDELAAVFATNDHRRQLLDSMRLWVERELQHVAAGLELVIGGSYLTTKVAPGDIDCTVIILVDQIAARGAAMQLLLSDGRLGSGRIHKEFKVDVYPTLRYPGANDFSAYFQYVGEKSALTHHCAADDKRGVVKVSTWLPG